MRPTSTVYDLSLEVNSAFHVILLFFDGEHYTPIDPELTVEKALDDANSLYKKGKFNDIRHTHTETQTHTSTH